MDGSEKSARKFWFWYCSHAKAQETHKIKDSTISIFVLPIVSDWPNVFIVTWLKYAEEELTDTLVLAPDWLTKC